MTKQIKELSKEQSNGSRPDYFINSRGIKVEFWPVKQQAIAEAIDCIRQKYIETNEPLEPPFYEYEVFGGGKNREPHTAETVAAERKKFDELSEPTDEQKKATEKLEAGWLAYQYAILRFNAEWSEAVWNLLVLDGVKNEPTEEWLNRRKAAGIPLPADKYKLKLLYATAELFPTNLDDNELQVMPRQLAYLGLSEEEYAQKERDFRHILETIRGRPRSAPGESEAG